MATVWYPARNVGHRPVAPWMPTGALEAFLTDAGFSDLIPLAPLTAGHVGAPLRRSGRRPPVVVFSHGAHSHQDDHTVMVQELASHGYAVATVAHHHDTYTAFPDDRITVPLQAPDAPTLAARALRRRPALRPRLRRPTGLRAQPGRRPAGAAGRTARFPRPPRRMGAFGWSKGGTATTCATLADPRLRTGLSLDGPMRMNPPLSGDLDRPFILMSAEFTRATDPEAAAFWSLLRGWRLNIQAQGAVHLSCGDNEALFPQVAKVFGWSDQQLQDVIGTLDPDQAVKIQQAYPLAFCDEHLRQRRRHLLDGLSPASPAATFLP